MEMQGRTWAEISLKALEHNFDQLNSLLPEDCLFLASVKADAYGHGAERVALRLQVLGADYFSTATLPEAIGLRECGVYLPILILGYTPPEYADLLVKHGLTQTVYSREYAERLHAELKKTGGRLSIHIKADSGMARLGFLTDAEQTAKDIAEVCELPHFEPEGIFTHFAAADRADGAEYTAAQYDSFLALLNTLRSGYGRDFEIKHCANSAAMINYPQMHMNMVRSGIALYGAYPSQEMAELISLEPVMELKAAIIQINELESGSSISYGATHVLARPSRIAVLPVGYADGFARVNSNRFQALVRGRRAGGVGTVCMDMCMIDVTDIPEAAVGDTATLFGRDGGEFISVERYAELRDTISYEILCAVSKRVPRVYLDDNE